MRGQLGPHLIPGNSAAARRCARARKPPPIILWSIGIITCLLILGGVAMLAVGYLNPFGTVGLSIFGVGAVVYFGAIIFLVLSCLWVERKYPGMQPLSFKFYSRKPQRPAPTAFVNPNISGQTPQTPPYRVHYEIPFNVTTVNDTEEITENVPSAPRDPTQKKTDKHNIHDLLEEMSSPDHDNQSTAQQSLQDEGSEDVSKGHVAEAITTTETSNQEGGTSAITPEHCVTKDKSNTQNDSKTTNATVQKEDMSQSNQKEYNLEKTAEREGKAQQKKFVKELPKEDYFSPENSTPSSSTIKESGFETQGSKPQDTTQQSRKLQKNNSLHIAMPLSISTSQEERSTTHQQKKKWKVDVPALSSTSEQKSTENQSLSVQQTQHNNSQTVKTETDRIFKKDQNAEDISQTENLQRQHAVRVKKQIEEPQRKNIQNISQEKVMGLPPAESSSLADSRKPLLHNKQDTVLQPPKADKNIDSAVLTKTTPGNERKRVQFQEYPVQSFLISKNLAQDNSKVADANNALQFKNDGRHGHQNKPVAKDSSATTAHFAHIPDSQNAPPKITKKPEIPKKTKKVESPERTKQDSPDRANKPELPRRERKPGSPERATRVESPERGRRHRSDHTLSHSPPNIRQIAPSSSPTRHHQNISPNAQRKHGNIVAMANLSSSKEDLNRKPNYHSAPSSQSSDRRTSTSSSTSPPRHHRRSPDLSPKVQKHQLHSSANADFSSARKEKRHDKPSQQSSQSSYSSDVQSSGSSSPQRHRRKDPDISSKPQRQNDRPTSKDGFPSNTVKDDLNNKVSQQSSQPNDVTLSPTMSPTKLLQQKLDFAKSARSQQTREPLIQTSGATGEYKQQTKHPHQDKPRTASHSRELSPTAARTSPPSKKRFPANPRKDQPQ